jgi:hypothetical protein
LGNIGQKKVFNTTVENTVDKCGCILVSDSSINSSALCTGARAGTFVVFEEGKTGRQSNHTIPSQP